MGTAATASTSAPSQHPQTLSQSLDPKPAFRPIPSSKPCNVNIELFEQLLSSHPDPDLVSYIIDGLKHGFDIGFTGSFSPTLPKNHKSADENKKLIQDAINREIARGHTAGPFTHPPFPQTHCSPIGAAPKKDGTVRLIMDLSQPHGSSINDDISKEDFPCEYTKFDDATNLLMEAGQGSLLCKLDVKHAYRLLPVRPDQWHHLCYFWDGKYYVDLVLPFGMRSSGAIFNQFASLIRWIIINHYKIPRIINYSDDFFAVLAKDMKMASAQLRTIIQAFKDLGVPLASEKIEGPVTLLVYLGIVINSLNMTIEVPEDKLLAAMASLTKWVRRRTCTKRQLKSLIGKLGHICKVVRPGRMFSRRLIDLSTTVKRMHHHITINVHARADIQWWIDFLPQWTAISMIPPTRTIRSTDLQLYSDASDIGFGATYGPHWIQGSWNRQMQPHSIDMKELYAILAAAFTWGHEWRGKRIVFVTDNKPITQVWDKGTSPSIPIMSLIRPLYLFAALNGFSVSFKHVYRTLNEAADALSKFQTDAFHMVMPGADLVPTELPVTLSSLLIPPPTTSKKKHGNSSRTP